MASHKDKTEGRFNRGPRRPAAIAADATEQRVADDQVGAGTRYARGLIEASLDPLVTISPLGKITDVNTATEQVTGVPREEIIGTDFSDYFAEPEEARAGYRQALAQGHVRDYPLVMRHTSGALTDVLYNATVDRDEAGRVAGVFAAARDITERRLAEQGRLANLRFLESMDQVNRALHRTNDLEQALSDVLDALLSIFACDRAWLVYPCDPEAASWRVPIERTRPEYPGALARKVEVPMDADIARLFRTVMAASGAVAYGPGTAHPLPAVVKGGFDVQSQICVLLRPKTGEPWVFGLHQCSYPRVWTAEEERLLQEVGRRLTDGLTSLLAYRDLRERSAELREAQRIARVGSWEWDAKTDIIAGSEECWRMLGRGPDPSAASRQELIETGVLSPETLAAARTAIRQVREADEPFEIELEMDRPDGARAWVIVRCEIARDADGAIAWLRGTAQDITESKHAAEKLTAAASQWRETFDAMQDSVCLLDEAGRMLRCNAATKTLTGHDYGQIIGHRCYEVFHRARDWHADCPQQLARRSLASETAIFEQEGHWLRATFQPQLDAQGGFAGGVHVVSDISELKETERQLHDSLTKLQSVTEEVIAAIGGIVEVRDPYTAGHQRRVSELAVAIAEQLGLDDDAVTGLRMAALLHDVGKIIVPAEILTKPGSLTEIEYRIIQGHAQATYDVLHGIEFPWPVAELALQHHERLDGSGYPQGLRGEEMLLGARILAVADVVEAMASHRPYRPALGFEAALEEIEGHRGTLYDARATEACVTLLRQKGFEFGA